MSMGRLGFSQSVSRGICIGLICMGWLVCSLYGIVSLYGMICMGWLIHMG